MVKLDVHPHGFWMARRLDSGELTDIGTRVTSGPRYWAVEEASVPALSRFCTATLLQLIQIDIQLAEEIVG